MKKIAIITDDVCSLPEKITKEFQIEIVKTRLYFPEWEKFPEKNLYQLMEETKATPKTSAPPPGDYLKAYKKVLKNFEMALVITVSSKLSGCFNSAFQAKNLFEKSSKIFLFDSLQAVAGQGLLVLEAAKLAREGLEIEEILKNLKNLREKIKFFGFLKTIYFARKTGRVNRWQAKAFKILKFFGILPYFEIKKGKVKLAGFNFWKKDQSKVIFDKLEREAKKGKIKVGINYTDNIDLAFNLKEKLEKNLNANVLFTSLAPPIVGANSGPGTLILAFYHV